ncbi:MAG TPA: glycine--tRNA ligase subunit beta [Paenalcaligenes sp.]|nr:glycine--tRNA ligase subunit beta [Paenalcaligenes sp.]
MTSNTQEYRSLLVELQTEELPPKALENMGTAFAEGIVHTLKEQHLIDDSAVVNTFATPRRLAVLIDQVKAQAEDQPFSDKLMPAKIGLDADGNITPALQKRLTSKGLEHLSADQLHVESDGKQDYLFAKGMAKGALLAPALQEALDYSLAHLPIPKVMRYQLADGVTSVRFVRPAHGLVALWGDDILPLTALGLQAGRRSLGHRFMCDEPLSIQSANSYEEQLLNEGKVIASFAQRRDLIASQLAEQCEALQASLGNDPEVDALLNEVTALVEHPTVYVGEFDTDFLNVPSECLILTMRLNQRYFPLFDPATQRLTNRFLIVSNMQVEDPSHIIEGNQRVILPRLADARFFFDTDRKTALADRVDSLEQSVYHNKLGSQRLRVERIRQIIRALAEGTGADVQLADRAALLAKADLNTSMVGEFPELQGVMGAYYAEADGEDARVVTALRQQYQHRLYEPVSEHTLIAGLLFLAERLETLVGIWAIGLAPTGERDPYALRRAALGVISAFDQLAAGGYISGDGSDSLRLDTLLELTRQSFEPGLVSDEVLAAVSNFIYERYRNQLVGEHDRNVVEAVLELNPPLHQVQARIQACAAFAALPEAESLASANKRISNLLRRAETQHHDLNQSLLSEAAELELAKTIDELSPKANEQFAQGQFEASLSTLAGAKQAVDNFFNDVMVMAEDPAIRANRLALLEKLHRTMNQVADLARLAA